MFIVLALFVNHVEPHQTTKYDALCSSSLDLFANGSDAALSFYTMDLSVVVDVTAMENLRCICCGPFTMMHNTTKLNRRIKPFVRRD